MPGIELVGNACTGCGACVNVCKRNSICMKANAEGFAYPSVDHSSCVDCGMCLERCPARKEPDRYSGAAACMAVLSKHTEAIAQSASGGVFYTIGKWFIDQGGIVCGALYGADKCVVHTCADNLDGLLAMQDSKYVQSNAADCYDRIRQYLDEGRLVLFSGTPCQVAGLYACVGRHERLWTADIVCHGVPSPAFLKKHIEYLEAKYHKTAQKIRFRMKDRRNRTAYRLRLFQDEVCWYDAYHKNDVYYNLFMDGITFRESCYRCRYACGQRIGDLTMGDLGSYRAYPDFHPDEATSVVIINSQHGRHLWEQVSGQFDFCDISYEKEQRLNHQLSAPAPRPELRDTIYSAVAQLTERELGRRYCSRLSFREWLSLTVKEYLPVSVIAWIRRRS